MTKKNWIEKSERVALQLHYRDCLVPVYAGPVQTVVDGKEVTRYQYRALMFGHFSHTAYRAAMQGAKS